jgi:predicted  nucleic acid-binding Zn-ribbon protein
MTYEEMQQQEYTIEPEQPEPNSVQEKIAKARKITATLKQIEKLEKEIATLKKKIEQKEQKLAELAEQL